MKCQYLHLDWKFCVCLCYSYFTKHQNILFHRVKHFFDHKIQFLNLQNQNRIWQNRGLKLSKCAIDRPQNNYGWNSLHPKVAPYEWSICCKDSF